MKIQDLIREQHIRAPSLRNPYYHQFGRIVPAYRIAELAEEIHHTPSDFEEGDIYENIMEYSKYHLMEIPTKSIRRGMFAIHEDLVNEYIAKLERGEAYPPVIMREMGHSIIDGVHRHEALSRLGIPKIIVYMGKTADIVPYEKNDEEEWNPDPGEYGFISD